MAESERRVAERRVPERRRIVDVSVRELSRNTSSVLHRLSHWHRVIVTSHGYPVAVLLSIADCVELLADESLRGRAGNLATRRKFFDELLGPELAERVRDRELRRLDRGRLSRSIWRPRAQRRQTG